MRKRALLVGLNAYPDPANRLRGCLNDVHQVRAALADHYGFREDGDFRVLTDTGATTRAIKSGLAWLVDGAAAGDVLVFHYSGHGSQVPDRHGDEASDGLDEIICPYDLDWDHPFTDDDLHEIVRRVPSGATLTVLLDCCHAGTGLRDLSSGSIRCLYPPARLSPGPAATRGIGRGGVRRFGQRAAENDGALLIAACRDDQVSADAFIAGDYHGALTFYLCHALALQHYAVSSEVLVREVRGLLRAEGFDQVPQLEGPHAARHALAFTASAVPA